MKWILLSFLVAAGLWVFFNSNLLGRKKTYADFEHAIRSLLVLMNENGKLTVRHRGSAAFVVLVRRNDSEANVPLLLRVPRADWSKEFELRLRRMCDAQGFPAKFRDDVAGDVLCEIGSMVADIWDPAAGAAGARQLSLVLDSLAIPRDARFDLALAGPRSDRFLERERALRKLDS